MNGNGGNERPHGTALDAVRPHPPRVPLGIRRRLRRHRAWRPCWPKTGSSRERPPRRRPDQRPHRPLAPKATAFSRQGQGVHRAVHVRRRQPGRYVRPQARAHQAQRQADPSLDSDPLLKVRNPGTLLGSSRTFARQDKPGPSISDLYPHLARRLDDIAVIRSMYTDSFAHGSGLLQMNTGFLRQGYPEPGLVGDLRAGNDESEPAGLRRPARPPRRPDFRARPTGARASCRQPTREPSSAPAATRS